MAARFAARLPHPPLPTVAGPRDPSTSGVLGPIHYAADDVSLRFIVIVSEANYLSGIAV